MHPASLLYLHSAAPSDYQEVDGSTIFTIPIGQTRLTVTVVILDDAIAEPQEVLSIRITNPRNSVIGENSTAIIFVQDTDGKNHLTNHVLVVTALAMEMFAHTYVPLDACPSNMYLVTPSNTSSAVCVPCPAQSVSIALESRECVCIEGYYRSQLEDISVPCTSE